MVQHYCLYTDRTDKDSPKAVLAGHGGGDTLSPGDDARLLPAGGPFSSNMSDHHSSYSGGGVGGVGYNGGGSVTSTPRRRSNPSSATPGGGDGSSSVSGLFSVAATGDAVVVRPVNE